MEFLSGLLFRSSCDYLREQSFLPILDTLCLSVNSCVYQCIYIILTFRVHFKISGAMTTRWKGRGVKSAINGSWSDRIARPYVVSVNPWNKVLVYYQLKLFDQGKHLDLVIIAMRLIAQVGIDPNGLLLRVNSVTCVVVPEDTVTRNSFALAPCDFTRDPYPMLTMKTAFGTAASPACLRYTWPMAISRHQLRPSSKIPQRVLSAYSTGSTMFDGTTIDLTIEVYWCSRKPRLLSAPNLQPECSMSNLGSITSLRRFDEEPPDGMTVDCSEVQE